MDDEKLESEEIQTVDRFSSLRGRIVLVMLAAVFILAVWFWYQNKSYTNYEVISRVERGSKEAVDYVSLGNDLFSYKIGRAHV